MPSEARIQWTVEDDSRDQPTERPLPQRQEDARRRLSWFLILALSAEIIWGLLSLSVGHVSFNTVKDVFALAFTPLVVLLTAITNFYLPK